MFAMSLPWIRALPRSAIIDGVLVAVVATVVVVGTLLLTGGRGVTLFGELLLAATAGPLLLRREDPRAALVAIVILSFTYDALNEPGGFFTLPTGLAIFFVADAGFRWTAAAAVGAVVAAFLAVGLLSGRGHVSELENALWFAGWLAASVVSGEVTRGRRAYREQVEQRALAAERTRAEEALRRAGEERIQIARELHDILAHRISLISVQSGAGLHLFDRNPEQAWHALRSINEASHQALGELRATLGVLRQVDEPEPRAPAPGLAQLDTLIVDAETAGVHVGLAITGGPGALPPGVDLAAYRIIQESLTNVVRHAHAAAARIAIAYGPADVEITVEDDGAGAVAETQRGPHGNGLLGMYERAAALGGELEAGPRPSGGFRVWARLPVGGA